MSSMNILPCQDEDDRTYWFHFDVKSDHYKFCYCFPTILLMIKLLFTVKKCKTKQSGENSVAQYFLILQ